MVKKVLLVLFSVLIISGVCFAQEEVVEEPKEDSSAVIAEESALVLEEIAVCTAVEDKEPQGVGTVFPDDLDEIYCFTKIVGASDSTSVHHIWYMNDQVMANVSLAVNSAAWRTWSSKKVNMGLGKGHVEVVSESGDVLGKTDFEIKAAEEEVEETVEEETAEEAEEPMKEETEEAVEEE
jgi:hypothetical protein